MISKLDIQVRCTTSGEDLLSHVSSRGEDLFLLVVLLLVVLVLVLASGREFLLVERLLATIKGMNCTMIRVSRYSF